MKAWTTIITFLFAILLGFCQEEEITYTEYSYSELLEMIKMETDSEFILKNAFVKPDIENDSRFEFSIVPSYKTNSFEKLNIRKQILFSNVKFVGRAAGDFRPITYSFFNNLIFDKDIQLINVNVLRVYDCVFNGEFGVSPDLELGAARYDIVKNLFKGEVNLLLGQSLLTKFAGSGIYFNSIQMKTGHIRFIKNKIEIKDGLLGDYPPALSIFSDGIQSIEILDNELIGKGTINFSTALAERFLLQDNNFQEAITFMSFANFRGKNELMISNNSFGNYVYFDVDDLVADHYIEWDQFDNKLVALKRNFTAGRYLGPNKFQNFKTYVDSIRFVDLEAFDSEIALRSKLHSHYKNKLAFAGANGVYVDIKNLETARLKKLYLENPSFEKFFTLKTNQFLQLFSEYGTKPAKSLIFSFYVILIFALFYVFFPNSWNLEGRYRLINRYTFFFRYLLRDDGIHEIYLESKKKNLELFHEFKKLIDDSNQRVPKFFILTALRIYYWGVTGTNFSANFLKKFDFIKGKWEELPKSQRLWKSIVITCIFIFAVIYDFIIKVLNALMLSVNAFTTLGFGEIPIKGAPRYLAILQGLIGWFMLTMFSVSLISQLLN